MAKCIANALNIFDSNIVRHKGHIEQDHQYKNENQWCSLSGKYL